VFLAIDTDSGRRAFPAQPVIIVPHSRCGVLFLAQRNLPPRNPK
jgi:hypothetical protein